MTETSKRKYLSVCEIQDEYLPICKKKIRNIIKDNISYKCIGGRMYVERCLLEDFLKDYKHEA